MKTVLGGWAKRVAPYVGFFLLPFLAAVYPVLFHYGNNAGILSLSSLFRQLPLLVGISLGVYILWLAAARKRPAEAANAAFVFLLFFNIYGLIFDGLRQWDRVRVEHYTLLAGVLLFGGYAAWLAGRVGGGKSLRLWQGACFVVGMLIAFNLAKIIPEEVNKARIRNEEILNASAQSTVPDEAYPDIYYIILDEMAGFTAVREYWHYDQIDAFEEFLRGKEFYLAESSHGETIYTFYEMAMRLNYQGYPLDKNAPTKYWGEYLASIGNNRAMQYLKSLGYQTIVFDELPIGFLPFKADIVYTQAPDEMLSWGSIFDDFGMLVLGNTMVKPFLGMLAEHDPTVVSHIRNMYFTSENVAQAEVRSPKFVYVHLLTPHVPFVFDANGGSVDPKNHENWDHYLGQYIYTVRLARTMIENILSAKESSENTVIILQSDHGARNMKFQSDTVLLENYPEIWKTLIVNALRLPGCDPSGLTQDLKPINTFPIIFNCYFDAGIPLQ
jgi:hypothetical protein